MDIFLHGRPHASLSGKAGEIVRDEVNGDILVYCLAESPNGNICFNPHSIKITIFLQACIVDLWWQKIIIDQVRRNKYLSGKYY